MGRRRQETLWIHRWSRWLIALIASIGGFGTAYLTIVKVMGATAACPTGGCDRVLSSPYATVFGLPLTLFGFAAYGSMVVMALGPLAINPETQKELRAKLENLTWLGLFMVASAMVVFSAYLMYLLAFEIKTTCIYCITSAIFTAAMLTLTVLGRRWGDVSQLLFTGVIVAVITLTGTLAVYAPISRGGGSGSESALAGESGPAVTAPSGPAEVALARHLESVGAKMYGAWWCPHCHDQKQLFGAEAAKQIPYIECDPEGQNPQPDVCRANPQVTGFPTWEVNGQYYPGTQTLSDLANFSGYSGPTDFRN